jgi:hypothetical protein
MNNETSNPKEILSKEAIDILRAACKNVKTRRAFVKNPRAVLLRYGVMLPDDIQLRVYQRKPVAGRGPKHDGSGVAEPIVDKNIIQYTEARQASLGLDFWWRSTHQGCPLGTQPHTTRQKHSVCDMWVVFAGPAVWVQDVPGTPFGHFEYPAAQTVCAISHDEWMDVTECLPVFNISIP